MKRVAVAFAATLLIFSLSGCSLIINGVRSAVLDRNRPTQADGLITAPAGQTGESAPEPDATQGDEQITDEPLDTQAADVPIKYVSSNLGVSFEAPASWQGKFRVVEGSGYLSVYFVPSAPFDETQGDGFLFTIARKTSDEDADYYDNAQQVDVGGTAYICGTSTDVSYSKDQPEYDTYEKMFQELSSVWATIRAVGE